MASAPKTREFLLDKCRNKYSWAAGNTRGTSNAIQWHQRDLETAFAEIDGLMAGLHYQDAAEAPQARPSSPLPPPPSQYPLGIQDDDLLLEPPPPSSVSPPPVTSQSSPTADQQPLASQWADIRSLRQETVLHHEEFRRLAESSADPLISDLLAAYPNAQTIRTEGAKLIKDILDGYRPSELKHVFAFTSFAYAVSRLLFKKGVIDESEILADLRVWRDLIGKSDQRRLFQTLALMLWPEAKDHLHGIPPASTLAPRVPPFPPPSFGSSANFSIPGLPTLPPLPPFPIHGYAAYGPPTDPSFPWQSCSANNTGLNLVSGTGSPPGLLDGFVDLLSTSNTFNNFAILAATGTSDYHPQQLPGANWPQRSGFDPPGAPPASSETHRPSMVAASSTQSADEIPMTRGLCDTGMFLAILVFLQDITELLCILSGKSISSRPNKVYPTQRDDQETFFSKAQNEFFKPRYQCPASKSPTIFALLSVAETVTKRGILRSLADIRHYLASVATVRLSTNHLFASG